MLKFKVVRVGKWVERERMLDGLNVSKKIYVLLKQPIHAFLIVYRCNVTDSSCFQILPPLLRWLRGLLL